VPARPQRIGWARLLERVFDIDMQRCPRCGAGQVKIISAILERAVIGKILTHPGLQPQPPPRSKPRTLAALSGTLPGASGGPTSCRATAVHPTCLPLAPGHGEGA
jgi:hypothetical protein